MNDEKKFATFEGIRYRFDTLELPESLKFVGLSIKGDNAKINVYHQEFAMLIRNKFEPYTEIDLWENMSTEDETYDCIFGCLVNSLDDIPTGLVGADTGFTKFAVITIKCNTVEELLNGNSIGIVHHNFMKMLPPEYADKVCPPAIGQSKGFATIRDVKPGDTSLINIYHADLFEKIEMSFYVPLKI